MRARGGAVVTRAVTVHLRPQVAAYLGLNISLNMVNKWTLSIYGKESRVFHAPSCGQRLWWQSRLALTAWALVQVFGFPSRSPSHTW